MFTTTNPATEQTLATYEFLTDAQLPLARAVHFLPDVSAHPT